MQRNTIPTSIRIRGIDVPVVKLPAVMLHGERTTALYDGAVFQIDAGAEPAIALSVLKRTAAAVAEQCPRFRRRRRRFGFRLAA